MDFLGIIKALLIVGGTGLIIGVLLSLASKIFYVEKDEKEEIVRELLPGNNCGACGYPGCDGLAKAIAEGSANVDACPVGGVSTAENIAKVMGVTVSAVKKVAFVKCSGDCNKAKDKFIYTGNLNCKEAVNVSGGPKACEYGCMGLGSCVSVCEFDAIHIINNIAYVDMEKCVACGKCVLECPKNLIEIVPYNNRYKVACNSKDKGPKVKSYCSTGCIACGICERNCPVNAIKVNDFLAKVNYELCENCGICAEKCPVKVITK
jgi:Na+-translocating ferredoxin:NAD+ oxidoreductase RNF subunit RnfB